MKHLKFRISNFLILFFALASIAQAHAQLDHAEPKVGSEVTEKPKVVKIWFSMSLLADGSKIEVKDSDDKTVSKDDSHLDSVDATELIVTVGDLKPGKFTVTWHATGSCTHKTQGSFNFTVK